MEATPNGALGTGGFASALRAHNSCCFLPEGRHRAVRCLTLPVLVPKRRF
jgi:hypothetical protein